MLQKPDTTIAALATPSGEGGIAVLRISGREATVIAARIFKPLGAKQNLSPREAVFGKIEHHGLFIDQGIALYFKAPLSYTGEDTVEISCHGGRYVAKKLLEAALNAGAQPAEPGEFTRRAFLNDKIDLIQAEAVANLIHADTEAAHRLARRQLSGALSGHFQALKDELKEILTLLEANIDFAEEEIELFDRKALRKRIDGVRARITEMAATYERGRLLSGGIRIAIAGPPNAGKSSLFNALCEAERVIVDKHPGTTRDLIEETVTIKDRKVTLIDTAGIRRGKSRVESLGIRLSRQAVRDADLALLVFDATKMPSKPMLNKFLLLPCRRKIVVLNKADLNKRISRLKGIETLLVSAKKGQGLTQLKEAILDQVDGKESGQEDMVLTSERQKKGLLCAAQSLEKAANLLSNNGGEELLSVDIRSSLQAIAGVTGEVTDDDILNNIFKHFCIGK